jgi:hypothetical protein
LARLSSIDSRFVAAELVARMADGAAPSVAEARDLAGAVLAQDPVARAALAVLREPTARAVLDLVELLVSWPDARRKGAGR